MRKNIIKGVACALLTLGGLASCELDQLPEGSLTNDASWENYERASRHYTALLSVLRSVSGGAATYISDLQTDLFNERVGNTSYSQLHDWSFTSTQFDGDALWSYNYSVLLQANDIIAHMPAFRYEGDDLTQTQLRRNAEIDYFLGAAYFTRAYAYMNLLPKYCKAYDPATAETDLGLPIVTVPSSTYKPARATMAQTLDTIQCYLDSAKYLFTEGLLGGYDNTQRGGAAIHEPGYDVTVALEARFDLYSQQYDKAIENAENIIGLYPLVSGSDALQLLWAQDEGSELIYEPLQTTEEQGQSYGIFVGYDIRADSETGNYYLFGNDPSFIPSKTLLNMYDASDLRGTIYFTNPYYSTLPISGQGDESENGTTFWKYPTNLQLLKNPSYEWYSYIYNMGKPFRSAEAYLIAAEASLKKENRDESAAKMYLNELRQARYSDASYSVNSLSGEELDQMMEDEWAREFVGEGFRFDCLKRWHKGFTRTPQVFRNQIVKPGAAELTITPDNFRWTWEIPQQDRQTNPNIQPNW